MSTSATSAAGPDGPDDLDALPDITELVATRLADPDPAVRYLLLHQLFDAAHGPTASRDARSRAHRDRALPHLEHVRRVLAVDPDPVMRASVVYGPLPLDLLAALSRDGSPLVRHRVASRRDFQPAADLLVDTLLRAPRGVALIDAARGALAERERPTFDVLLPSWTGSLDELAAASRSLGPDRGPGDQRGTTAP